MRKLIERIARQFVSENSFAFPVFKTDDSSSVVQTSNATAYSLCDAEGPETLIYSPGHGDAASASPRAATIAVPLTVEGANYFFSEAGDGAQCEEGCGSRSRSPTAAACRRTSRTRRRRRSRASSRRRPTGRA